MLTKVLMFKVKRIIDFFVSIFLFIFLFPFFIIITIIVWIDTKTNPFFLQERIGKNGKVFKVIKFRTMYKNADEILKNILEKNKKAKEEWIKYRKLKNDPRVTKLGKFLRRFSLDELPQIINVIKGDMSLVGPRPYLKKEFEDYKVSVDVQKKILSVYPGITGLWQVSGRNNLEFEDRIKLDVYYVENWSLWLDFIILLKTVKVVIKKEGAY